MAKTAFVADVHLGFANKYRDIMWALRCLREYCARESISEVIVLGDLFHDRQSLNIETLCGVYGFLEEAKTAYNQTWIAFPGNHDMFLKHSWNINSLKPLRSVLTVIDNVKQLSLDDRRFWILPFVQNENAYMNVLHQLERMSRPDDVLLTHIGVHGSTLNICFLLQDWSAVTFENSDFTQVFTGHFHVQQTVGTNVVYPGSIIPFRFDEGDSPHGFVTYDLVTGVYDFVDLWDIGPALFPDEPLPPSFHTVHDQLIESTNPSVFAGNNIRVAMTKNYSLADTSMVREHLQKLGAKQVVFLDLIEREDKVELRTAGPRSSVKADQLFERWLEADKTGVKNLETSLLRKLNRGVVSIGNELYQERNLEQGD